jgi:hypothetical protein
MASTVLQPYFKRLYKVLKDDDTEDQWQVVELFQGFRAAEQKVFQASPSCLHLCTNNYYLSMPFQSKSSVGFVARKVQMGRRDIRPVATARGVQVRLHSSRQAVS